MFGKNEDLGILNYGDYQKGGAQLDKKKYTVTYKDGQKETVTGSIVFFSSANGNINRVMPKTDRTVYLNSDSVRSVIEVETEGEMTDGANE